MQIGIAGIGFMGMIHFLTYQKVRGVKVAALCETDKVRLAGDWRTIKGNFGPPGQMTTAQPVARARSGRCTVIIGLSRSSPPSAPGAPSGHRKISCRSVALLVDAGLASVAPSSARPLGSGASIASTNVGDTILRSLGTDIRRCGG